MSRTTSGKNRTTTKMTTTKTTTVTGETKPSEILDNDGYQDNIIVRGWDAVRRLRESERREEEFRPVGVPSLTAQAMLKHLNRNWVVARMEAGRLLEDVLKKLAEYE